VVPQTLQGSACVPKHISTISIPRNCNIHLPKIAGETCDLLHIQASKNLLVRFGHSKKLLVTEVYFTSKQVSPVIMRSIVDDVDNCEVSLYMQAILYWELDINIHR
jgi:hypothetical protein